MPLHKACKLLRLLVVDMTHGGQTPRQKSAGFSQGADIPSDCHYAKMLASWHNGAMYFDPDWQQPERWIVRERVRASETAPGTRSPAVIRFAQIGAAIGCGWQGARTWSVRVGLAQPGDRAVPRARWRAWLKAGGTAVALRMRQESVLRRQRRAARAAKGQGGPPRGGGSDAGGHTR